jgi:hypothetical protein
VQRYPNPAHGPALAQVVSQTPLAAFFWHKEIEALLTGIVENGTAQACHGGASQGDGSGRAGHVSVSCPLVQPGRPVDLRSLPTGNVDIALNTVRARKRAGRRHEPRRSSPPGSVKRALAWLSFREGRISHRSVGSRPLSRSPCLRRAGGTRTRDLVHPKHAR